MRARESIQAYRQRLAPALELLESRLGTDALLEEAAWTCCLSPFHFHRTFASVVGATPASYLRERRLSEAARELLQGEERISDLALRFGYGSPEAFSRAFRAHFHLWPSEYRTRGVPVFLRASELACPEAVAQPLPQEIGTPAKRPAVRLAGLSLSGRNHHPTNMRLLYEYLDRRPSDSPMDWIVADRHVPCPEGMGYEFFVGQEVECLTDLPAGLEALEIPARLEVEVRSLGSVCELHEEIPDLTDRHLERIGLEAVPSQWKLETSCGPVGWSRIGWRHRIALREA